MATAVAAKRLRKYVHEKYFASIDSNKFKMMTINYSTFTNYLTPASSAANSSAIRSVCILDTAQTKKLIHSASLYGMKDMKLGIVLLVEEHEHRRESGRTTGALWSNIVRGGLEQQRQSTNG